MKATSFLIFIAVIAVINSSLQGFTVKRCDDYYNKQDIGHQAYSLDFCKTLDKSNYDSEDKCCFLKYKRNGNTYYNCRLVRVDEFHHIKDTIKSIKASLGVDGDDVDVKSLECSSSSYLFGSLLLLLVLLF